MGGRGTTNQRAGVGKRCSTRADALKRLGFIAPPESNPLALYAIQVAGSKRKFLEYARTSEHPGVRALIQKWDGLSRSDRRALTITDLCAASEVKFSTLLAEVTGQAFEHNSDVSKLLAAVSQPRVVKATIDSAIRYLGPDGVKDRQMLHSHSNFLPVPKSASTIFRFQQQINNARESDGDEPTSLPSFSSDIIAFNAAQRGKLLPPTLDAAVEPDEDD